MPEQPPDQAHDATRRTRLANERTYLAWWRTGLTALAVSIGFGKIVPGVSDVARWPFTIAGVGFIGNLALVNSGTINAATASAPLQVFASTVNAGKLEATTSGTLY